MRFTRVQAMFLVAALHILIPALLVFWLWTGDFGSVTDWAARILFVASYVLFIYLIGSWAFASYYVRYALVLVFLAALLRSFFDLAGLPIVPETTPLFWIRNGILASGTIALFRLSIKAVRARHFDKESLNLSFPFEGGIHVVFEGGDGRMSPLMNYHYGSSVHGKSGVNNSMKYAVDITRLSAWGNDAYGFFPRVCPAYPVFNESVLSPCDGVIAGVADDLPNEEPWSGKGPYNLGNYVLLRTGDVYVLLGHLQKGSIRVKTGHPVKKGELVARAGNSGWTSQPHLHIQAMGVAPDSFWKGEGIPITFDGRIPFKNKLFIK